MIKGHHREGILYNLNYRQRKNAKFIFLTATLDAAIWGAELSVGEGRDRIYLVEPTEKNEDDPDLTDKNFRVIQQNPIDPLNHLE